MRKVFIAIVWFVIACIGVCGQVKKAAVSELPDAPSKTKANTDARPSTTQTPGTTSLGLSSQEGWPKEIKSGADTFTVYQPQLESWNDDNLEARAAVAVRSGAKTKTSYGVVWFSARTQVDKQNRMVTLTEVAVKKVRFPAAPGEESAYLAIIQKSVINKARLIALDRLEALAEILDAERHAATVAVNNDPPAILFSQSPGLLVYVDGEPAYRPMKDSALHRVVNTRCLIVRDAEGKHYLHLMDGWMESAGLTGPWTVAKHIRSDLGKVRPITLNPHSRVTIIREDGIEFALPGLK